MALRLAIALALVAASLGAPSRAIAARIVTIGDSWGARGAGVLAGVLTAHGYPGATVDDRAIEGTTAAYWADNPGLIDAALAANPDAGYVWLILGGNDVTNALFAGRLGEAKAANERNLAAVVDRIFSERPRIQIVTFGYDYPALVEVPGCLDPLYRLLGIDPPEVIDPGFANLVTSVANLGVLDAVGAVLGNFAGADPRIHYVPLWGALQRAGGRPANPLAPSPGDFYADCIHPTEAGFRAIMEAFHDAFWAGEFGGSPTLACAAAPAETSPLAFAPIAALVAGLGAWRIRRILRARPR